MYVLIKSNFEEIHLVNIKSTYIARILFEVKLEVQ
jgi:hypothetical protein